jgi:hypothetical protein
MIDGITVTTMDELTDNFTIELIEKFKDGSLKEFIFNIGQIDIGNKLSNLNDDDNLILFESLCHIFDVEFDKNTVIQQLGLEFPSESVVISEVMPRVLDRKAAQAILSLGSQDFFNIEEEILTIEGVRNLLDIKVKNIDWGWITFKNVDNISTEIAEEFKKFHVKLSFPKVRTIHATVAQSLTQNSNFLSLGIDKLSSDIAKYLFTNKTSYIFLSNIKEFDDDVIPFVKNFNGFLLVNGCNLSKNAFEALWNRDGETHFEAVEFNDEVLRTIENLVHVRYDFDKFKRQQQQQYQKGYWPIFEFKCLRITNPSLARLQVNILRAKSRDDSWYSGLTILALTIDEKSAEIFAGYEGSLNFKNLETLDASSAIKLGSHRYQRDSSSQSNIAKSDGPSISLDKLQYIQNEFLTNISGKVSISLNGLVNIEIGFLQELVKKVTEGNLSFNGLTKLSEDAAYIFGNLSGVDLYLNGIKELDRRIARGLAKHQGILSLKGVTNANDEIHQELRRHQGSLDLPQATSISEESAKEIVEKNKNIPGLSLEIIDISPAVARIFVEHAGSFNYIGSLSFPKINAITYEVAKIFGEFKGSLYMMALQNITKEIAQQLVQNACHLHLGITECDAETARMLAKCKESLYLEKLKNASSDVIWELSAFCGKHLSIGLESLNANEAKDLSNFKGDLQLISLTMVNDEALANFSRHVGWLTIGISEISDELASALSVHNGGLVLRSLRHASDKALKYLTKTNGSLYLGLEVLTEEGARALAQHSGQLGLESLLQMSDNIAKIFATRNISDIKETVNEMKKWTPGFKLTSYDVGRFGKLSISYDMEEKIFKFIKL